MGVGMQIVCVGFAGSAALEAEAAVQLVRLERFRARLEDCRLVIELRPRVDGGQTYDVRLELAMRGRSPVSLPSGTGDDVIEVLGRVFALAEQTLSVSQAGESGAVVLHAVTPGATAQ
ncbi:metal ABC transporter ATPase [Burkholderia sp. AU33545]|uniref:metal ABC transporter ATPase n=1 Tax=Burkholderia sp. AU33545 TaxID=2879631 RepID=UPI001CF37457|nr:metal ABC transporter ATPase [Burkholderia sp. AU33545]MCA8202077.1 metal ABC transporter ATPase [Burkholderia sp. AU33545]